MKPPIAKLMAQSRQAILSGDYASLSKITTEIEQNLSATHGLNGAHLALIKALARENMALLEAAREGVKAAIHGAKAAQNQSFRTYNEGGSRQAMTPHSQAPKQRL